MIPYKTFRSILLSLVSALLSLPLCLNAQTISQKDSKLAFIKLNLSFPTHYNLNDSGRGFQNDLQQDLFTDNIFVGVEADYFFNENWAISPGINFTYSKANRDNSIFFAFPPAPGTISVFKTDYNFFVASLEPKLKFMLPYSNINFFWTVGPIFSYGSLSSNTDGAPFDDPQNFRSFNSSHSRSFGYGFSAATGMQIRFTNQLSLSLEAGYRYGNFSSFSLNTLGISGQNTSFNYGTNSFTPSVGLVYRL